MRNWEMSKKVLPNGDRAAATMSKFLCIDFGRHQEKLINEWEAKLLTEGYSSVLVLNNW